jgi:hypothetical protein
MIRKLWRLAALVTIGSRRELLLVHSQLPSLFFLKEVALARASVFGFRTGSAGLYAEIRLKEKGHT